MLRIHILVLAFGYLIGSNIPKCLPERSPKSIKIIHFIRIFHSKIQPKTKSPPAPGFFRAWRRLGIDHAPQELPRGRAQHVVRAEQGMGCQEMMTLEQRLGETTRGHTLEGI